MCTKRGIDNILKQFEDSQTPITGGDSLMRPTCARNAPRISKAVVSKSQSVAVVSIFGLNFKTIVTG